MNENNKLDDLLNNFSSKLSILNQYGISLLSYIGQKGPLKTEYVPVVCSLRHTMELLEGIAVLIRNQLADPSMLLLRGVFESVIQTLFILDKDVEIRGRSFMYYDLLNQIDWIEKMDSSSQKGKELQAWIQKDIYLNGTNFSKPTDTDKHLSDLINQKGILDYAVIHAEYENQKANGRKIKNWFSLFNGPQNIEQVAADINLGGTYQIFYRHLSESVHGTGVVKGKIIAKNGKGVILDIKAPDNIQYVVSTSISVSIILLKKIIDSLCPEKDKEWTEFYINEIREVFLRATEGAYIKINNKLV
ncbi:MAG: DUF5677 domain-containing protein [bacterium]